MGGSVGIVGIMHAVDHGLMYGLFPFEGYESDFWGGTYSGW